MLSTGTGQCSEFSGGAENRPRMHSGEKTCSALWRKGIECTVEKSQAAHCGRQPTLSQGQGWLHCTVFPQVSTTLLHNPHMWCSRTLCMHMNNTAHCILLPTQNSHFLGYLENGGSSTQNKTTGSLQTTNIFLIQRKNYLGNYVLWANLKSFFLRHFSFFAAKSTTFSHMWRKV